MKNIPKRRRSILAREQHDAVFEFWNGDDLFDPPSSRRSEPIPGLRITDPSVRPGWDPTSCLFR